MLVHVENKYGKELMPCSPRKARKLIENKKAMVIEKLPFKIKLIYGSAGYKQNKRIRSNTMKLTKENKNEKININYIISYMLLSDIHTYIECNRKINRE